MSLPSLMPRVKRSIKVMQITIEMKQFVLIPFIIRALMMLRFMVFNATFNNSSVISWRSVLFVVETGVPIENRRPIVCH
jgi:hypothetical protein